MKLLTAIIRPEKLDDALAAIAESASVRLATARSGSAAWRVCCGSGPVSGTTTHPRHHATGTLTSSRSGWSRAPCRASSSKWAGHCGPASPAPAARRYPRPGRPGHSRPGRVIMSHIRVRRSTLGLFMFFPLTLAVYLLVPWSRRSGAGPSGQPSCVSPRSTTPQARQSATPTSPSRTRAATPSAIPHAASNNSRPDTNSRTEHTVS